MFRYLKIVSYVILFCIHALQFVENQLKKKSIFLLFLYSLYFYYFDQETSLAISKQSFLILSLRIVSSRTGGISRQLTSLHSPLSLPHSLSFSLPPPFPDSDFPLNLTWLRRSVLCSTKYFQFCGKCLRVLQVYSYCLILSYTKDKQTLSLTFEIRVHSKFNSTCQSLSYNVFSSNFSQIQMHLNHFLPRNIRNFHEHPNTLSSKT